MTALIKIEWHYPLLFLLLLNSLIGLSQNSKPLSFKDYPIVPNLDSFERVVLEQKNNPEQYLYGLIALEIGRIDYEFGQDLNTIKTLAYQLRSPLAIATYNYLQGFYLKERNIEMAARNILEATRYFETAKDTLGMMRCYYAFLYFNRFSSTSKSDKILSSNIYFDRILNLSQQSDDIRIRAIRIQTIGSFEKVAKGKQNFDERVCDIEDMILMLDKYSNYQPFFASVYNNIAAFYARYDLIEKEYEHAIKSYELFKKLSSKICVKSYFNMANDYYHFKNYKKTESLLKEIIPYIENDRYIYRHVYALLAEIKYIDRDYKAAMDYKQQELDIIQEHGNKLKNSIVEELKTQYEIEQKEKENTLYRIILGIGSVSFIIVCILVYFLYRANEKQKKLILFRDQLFGIIAHDMRSPLTAFRGVSESLNFLLRKGEYQSIPPLSKSIDQSIFNANLLLDNLLDWYALQNPNTKTTKSVFSVYELVKESKDLYENIAKTQQSSIEMAVPDSLNMFADRNALLLILRNLIDNALKHGQSKNIMVKAYKEAYYIAVEVKNNGTILSPRKLSVLQQQIKQSSVVTKEGRGLGLYLVAHFVAQHNGQLTIHSSEEDGTIFKI
ncbi:MAG: HAMP domain-containing histidine kinase, partial [Saprospiraceae bacterium]|nr:HAMP domain-containing histidine kinase [Saprospiraceae bacterium]